MPFRLAVVLGIVVCAASLSAADYEQVTLKDGRTLVGFYDPIAGTVTIASPKAVIPVDADNVASHLPVPPPKVKEATGQEPTLDAIWDRKIALMQQERDMRRKQAAEQRELADKTDDRATKDEALMTARQNELAVEKIDKDIELAKEKQALAKSEALAQAKADADAKAAQAHQAPSGANHPELDAFKADQKRAEEARRNLDEASRVLLEETARVRQGFINSLDFTPVDNPIHANPTVEQLAQAQRIASFNQQLEAVHLQPPGHRTVSDDFLRAYAEFKNCPWFFDVLGTGSSSRHR